MRRGLLATAIAAAAFFASAGQAMAAAPTIVNTSNWLESQSTAGQTNNSANVVHVTVLVKHDPGVDVDQLIFDDDWDGTNDPSSVKTNFTQQKPTIQGG